MDSTLKQEIGERYGDAVLQGLEDSLEATEKRELDFIDVKHLGDITARYRREVRTAVARYRAWASRYADEGDDMECFYARYEGAYLKSQIRAAWDLYRLVLRDYLEMYDTYLTRIRQSEPKAPDPIAFFESLDEPVPEQTTGRTRKKAA